ncbi:hypothetical protein NE237_006539 [Protea cynaroides]|uniref:Uncharacterized protein n=1 Tax=Protea cynaroides TaxID=273540 RepID=A0A9Q0QVJ1_9MAGN|nr:hypothetical protein NE237_006539 [Protea cynaroides]
MRRYFLTLMGGREARPLVMRMVILQVLMFSLRRVSSLRESYFCHFVIVPPTFSPFLHPDYQTGPLFVSFFFQLPLMKKIDVPFIFSVPYVFSSLFFPVTAFSLFDA